MIEVNQYYEPENTDYAGNPLITLLPPLNPDIIAGLMTSPAAFYPERREHEDHLRIQYILGLMEFFIPMDHQVAWAWKAWSLVCQNYRHRNPSRKSTTAAFNELCASIRAGQVKTDDAAHFLDSPWCTVLIGTPGVGKSSTVNSLFGRLGTDLYHHKMHGQMYQLLSIRVQSASSSTGKALSLSVFRALQQMAAESGHPVPFAQGRPPETGPDLLYAIKVLADKLNLGAIVLDELQHLYRGTGAMDEEAMKFLTGLVNLLKVPLFLIGTWPCMALLGLEARLARRSFSPTAGFFRRMTLNDEWRDFAGALLNMQYVRNPVEVSEGYLVELYKHSQGIQDVAVKLFVLAQLEAIADGSETLSLTLLQRVADEHMSVLAPWVSHMQRGASEEDTMIYDAEPVDFAKYIELFQARVALRASRLRSSRRVPLNKSAAVYQIADALVTTGALDVESAQALAADSLKKAPHKHLADHVTGILEDNKPKGPKPTKSTNPLLRKKVVDGFERLDDDDIRKVVFLALANRRTAEQGLREAGYMCDAVADVPF
jgi:hypothetical protein